MQAQQGGGVNVMMGGDESTATLELNTPHTARLFAMALLTAAEEAEAFLRAAE
ncbi:MFS transporter [Acetobacter orientalis]|uniref:MFS transporter n=1 Tax=Acetobacter orientalis TaxID=146474 RepID=A0A2Z5ZMG9_9PROT|nr:MFS transporter [Acetobacter orientalis]